ncbi:prolyl oligopeptidase family protein [Saccharicrinis sp. FJH54]|uniref:prolyl oligopeptidase family serine peptidase n=1 Tax=Saccharicrinis sp. FJH54 TaxID=3344665 RepID=UPI0035D3E714
MQKLTYVLLIPLLMACNAQHKKIEYPETKKGDVVDNYFGTEVADPFRWLEDDQSDATKEWVKAENKVTNDYLSQIPFRDKIFNRLKELWDYPKSSAPSKHGSFYLESRNNGLQNQSVLYIMDSPTDSGRILIDPNTLSDDGTVALAGTEVSDDYKYIAYLTASGGSDWNEIYVRDIATGKDLPDHIQWVKFSGVSWYKDGFLYSRYPEPKKGEQLKGENKDSKIYYHKLGTPQSQDVVWYEDPEHPDWMFGAGVSDDKKVVIISVTESTTGNALYVMDPKGKAVEKIIPGFDNDYVVIYAADQKLWVYTNYQAPRYQLIQIDLKKPQKKNWKVIVPENDNVLTAVKYIGGKLMLEYMVDAKSQVAVCNTDGKVEKMLDLPVGSVGGFTGEPKDTETYFTFASFTTPSTVYKYDIANDELTKFSEAKIKFDSDDYETKQVFYTSKDGTKIPMFITYKKGMKPDGSHPTLLYGYGGFNVSLTPVFSVTRLIWLENNGVVAIPNLRGGGEYGEKWHEAGTLMQKQNVFDDFISAAEYLIKDGYTSKEKLTIQGGSNGGLLIGACINQRPDLFAVALPAVGVMDMLRYHKFTIGRFWATDYGTSEDSREMFNYLYSYSPVHTVKEGADYPAVLVTTADHDDRVVPAHSFKFAATLQEKVSDKNPALIRIDTKAGHGAGKPTDMVIQEYADLWSFAFYNMDVKPVYK